MALLAGVLAPALAGCGLVPDRGSSAVSLTITRDFGARRVADVEQSHVVGSETLLGLLQQRFPVQMAGNAVKAIDGVKATRGSRWFLFVNGSASGIGPRNNRTVVHAGDRIWWDLQANRAVAQTVVGSFPEPFVHGVGGKRLPVTLECAPDVTVACNRVANALAAVGVPAPRQLLGTGSGTSTLGIVVGTWTDVEGEIATLMIAHGPGSSGIFARFAGPDGRTLELLDSNARVARRLTDAGLIAVTGNVKSVPTWFVTGTDVAGVSAAASALTAARLRDHLAIAVQGTRDLPLPQP